MPRPVLSASLGPPTYPVGNEGPSPQKWSRGAGERRAGPQSGISPMLLRRHIGLRAVGTLIKKTRRRWGGCTVETMAGRGNEAGKMSPLSFCVCPSPGPMNSPPNGDPLFHFTDEETEAGGRGRDLHKTTWLEAKAGLEGPWRQGGWRRGTEWEKWSQGVCSELATMQPWSAGQGN